MKHIYDMVILGGGPGSTPRERDWMPSWWSGSAWAVR